MTGSERTYGGRTATERAAERRDRLIAASVAVLGERGESAATMTAICAEAGLTERYFYESFASRDEALLAAVDRLAAELSEVTIGAIASADGPAADRVHAGLAALVAWFAADRARSRVVLVESAGHPILRERRRQLFAGFADIVADEGRRLYGDQAWPVATARASGLLFAAGLAELIGAWLEGSLDLAEPEVVDLATELFARLSGA